MASARKPLSFAINPYDLTRRELIVAKEEGTANSVPAAAVIQRSQALSLHQACAHCEKFSTAATRRCLDRVSVPVWLVVLLSLIHI